MLSRDILSNLSLQHSTVKVLSGCSMKYSFEEALASGVGGVDAVVVLP